MILYPWAERYLQEQQQLQLLTQWDQQQQTNTAMLSPRVTTVERSPSAEQGAAESISNSANLAGLHMLGTISIDKIALREPMLEGTTQQTLSVGVGTVEPNRQPGELGNFVLAGHRSWTQGRQFSRLDELADGDEIIISTDEDLYTYTVTSTFLVTPDDLSVLEEDGDSAEITLITCEPAYNPTHRLIVKAELQESLKK